MRMRIAIVAAAVVAGVLVFGLWARRGAPALVDGAGRAPAMAAASPTAAAGREGGAAGGGLRVEDAATGQPVAGARVEASSSDGARSATVCLDARSRADGWVAAGDGCAPDATVEVSADGYFGYQGGWPADGVLRLWALPPTRGRVRYADGRPAAGAQVLEEREGGRQTRADAEGGFTLVRSGTGPVLALHEGLLASGDDGARPGQPPPALELVLDEGVAHWLGLVLTVEDRPIAGVEVTLLRPNLRLTARTDDEGRFELPQLTGGPPWRARFEHPGYVTDTFDIAREGDARRIRLSRPAGVRGQVVDVDGRPVPGALVGARSTRDGDGVGEPTAVTTDARGAFRFEGLRAGPTSLLARVEEDERQGEVEVELEADREAVVTVRLEPRMVLVPYTVEWSNGDEVLDVELLATPVPAAGWTRTGWTEPRRGSLIELATGRYRFTLTVNGAENREEVRFVDAREDGPPLRFVVPAPREDEDEADDEGPPPRRLMVSVVDAAGAPMPGAEVTCPSGDVVDVEADGRARCEYDDEVPWPLRVTAVAGGLRGGARLAEAVEQVEVRVGPARALRVRLVGEPPPAGAVLRVVTATSSTLRPLEGDDFVVASLTPGPVSLCVEASSAFSSGEDSTLGCATVEGESEVVLRLGPPGRVRFRAELPGGRPVPALEVGVDGADADEEAAGVGGVYVLRLSPGQHVLVVRDATTGAAAAARAEVHPGQETSLGLLVLRGGRPGRGRAGPDGACGEVRARTRGRAE